MPQERMKSSDFVKSGLASQVRGHSSVAVPGFKPAVEPESFRSGPVFYLQLPIKTISEINNGKSNRAARIEKVARKRAQKEEILREWQKAFGQAKVTLPCVVTFTRIGPRQLDDDNLRSAFKACRDQMAAIIGVDDGSSRIHFDYQQQVINKRAYGIRIEVVSE